MTKVTADYVEVIDVFPAAHPSKKNAPDNLLYSGKVVDFNDGGKSDNADFTVTTNILIAKLFTFQGPDGPKYFVHRNAIVATF